MKEILWNPCLEIGVDTIDEEHKRLVKIANAIVKIARDGGEKSQLVDAFSFLHEYALTHFDNEEAYMKKVRYKGYDDHHAEHLKLKKQVKDFQRDLYEAGGIPAQEIITFIKSWLLDHIIKTDMKLRGEASAGKPPA
ncbi:MAG: hypothetical protein FD177_1711 [Desulfovibrionaceae bacterium]|nr:MAG: hypothetical protein FD177_1711 [Desulfovibrionaceae bacterium]